MERWAEYVEDLYKDENRGEADMGDLVNEVYTISSEEIVAVIKDLPKRKACRNDNISAELLQSMGEKGIEIMTSLINKIYKSGYVPEVLEKVYLYRFQKSVKRRSVVTLEQSHWYLMHQRLCYIW